MALLFEKIAHSNWCEVKLYREGVFWAAYEQSAYFVWLLKAYKPTKKQLKKSTTTIVQVGFPVVTDFLELNTAKTLIKEDNFISFQITTPIDRTAFENWKEALPVFEPKINLKEALPHTAIVDSIKQFDVSAQTPLAAMLFIVELKKKIHNGNL